MYPVRHSDGTRRVVRQKRRVLRQVLGWGWSGRSIAVCGEAAEGSRQ